MSPRHPLHFSVLLAVAVGGALGATARYALTAAEPHGSGFPWATFAVNVGGSFLLGLLPAFAAIIRHRLLPPLLGTGVLGGFTTLSAYSEQTRALVDAGSVATAGVYAAATVAACLVAVAMAQRFTALASRLAFDEEEGDL
ncbi:fluoride efflux transporter FluC [Nocardioides pakistanensis]